MPIRSWAGIQTLVANSQPVFGTAMNGAGSLAADPYTLKTGPGNNQSQSVLPVTTTVGWRKNDRVLVGPEAGPYDQGSIFSIQPGVSLTVDGLLVPHADGELVILNEDVAQVTLVPVLPGNGTIYLGNAYTVSPTDPSVFDVIAPPADVGQPTYWHNPPTIGGGGAYKTSEYWIFGTAGAQFFARMHIL